MKKDVTNMIASSQLPLLQAVFAKLLSVVLTIVSLFTVAKPQNVALTVRTATPETVKIEFKNNTGKVISPEQRWTLEKKTGNGYEEIPFLEDDPGWNEIAESCPPTLTGVRTIDAQRCFGRTLLPGEYRFTFFYLCEISVGLAGGEPQSVSVGFTIPE